MSGISGGCACGAIRYSVAALGGFAFHCQCRQFQRITGSGHASQFSVRWEDFSLGGTLTFYELTADSGHRVRSGFCAACGSPVLKETAGRPGMVFVHAGSLDNPALFQPTTVVWSQERQPWDYVNPELKSQ